METFCVNLNIHYSVPQEIWDKLECVYSEMPHWKGFTGGCPQWYGEDGKLIEGSVESGGLQLNARLPQDEWNEWLQLFKSKATEALGYPIGEPEDEFEFQYWELGETNMDAQDYIDEMRAKKRRNLIIGVVVAAACLLLFVMAFAGGNGGRLSEAEALDRVPGLALTDAELALADTILDHEDFRNALSYDLVENTTTFTPEETEAIIGSVIPADGAVTQVCVSGAVVIIAYSQPQHQIVLEYADADRSGTVDQIRKTLTPLIDGAASGCYRVDHNLTTGKIEYTYTSN